MLRQVGSPQRATRRSQRLMEEARLYLPGGVNSPVRAFGAVGGEPVFMERGSGSRLYDLDGNEYIDCVCSFGPLILGHAHPGVVRAVREAAEKGTSFGAPTRAEVELAKAICGALPSVEQVRLVNSGTEAVMSAIRLSRAFTGRDLVVKFEGCYHGHSDGLLSKAGSGLASLGIPDSPGVPASFAQQTITLPFNDLEAVARFMGERGGEVACLIVEPVAGNMGVVPPAGGFLDGLRDLATRWRALLIFDEVITGFRLEWGGAQTRYGVMPDLTCLGKVIGGGFPVGAYGGAREIMEMVAPMGPVYQAGTLSGNPVAVAAGLQTLDQLRNPNLYDHLDRLGQALESGLAEAAKEQGLAFTVNRVGSMLTSFFTPGPVTDYASARASHTARYAAFFRSMLEQGVYLPPSQFEAAFLSAAHTYDDVLHIIEASRHAFALAARVD